MTDDDRWLRFAALKRMKLVTNHPTLQRWIEQEGFPAGIMAGPNTRIFRESEVKAWLASRQTKSKRQFGAAKWKGGRS